MAWGNGNLGGSNKSSIIDTTLLASNWNDNTYSLSISTVTASSNQEILPTIDITEEELAALQAANIQDAGQSSGVITLKAFGEVPTIDLPVRIILRGDV